MKRKMIKKTITAVISFVCMTIMAATPILADTPSAGAVAEENPHKQYTGNDPLYTTYVYKTPHWDASRKAFIYQDVNVQAHSTDTTYHTNGFEFSRIKTGIKADGEPYKSHMRDMSASDPHVYEGSDRESIYIGTAGLDGVEARLGQKTVCTYIITLDQLLTYIQNHSNAYGSSWYAEIQDLMDKGEDIYFGCDAIISLNHNGKACTSVAGTNQGDFIVRSHLNIARSQREAQVSRWNNYTYLSGVFSGTTFADISNHYNKILKITGTPVEDAYVPPKAEPDPAEEFCHIIKDEWDSSKNTTTSNVAGDAPKSGDEFGAPNVYTSNESEQNSATGDEKFQIHEGIPTTENIINRIYMDKWYGHTTMMKHPVKYTVKVDYEILAMWEVEIPSMSYSSTQTPGSIPMGNDVYGTPTVIKELRMKTVKNTYNYVFRNYYYYARFINMLEVSGATARNGSYGSADYSRTADVPYHLIIADASGKYEVSTGDNINKSSFSQPASEVTAESYHIKLPEISDSERKINETKSYGSEPSEEEVYNYVKGKVDAAFADRYLLTRDDTIQMDNVNYSGDGESWHKPSDPHPEIDAWWQPNGKYTIPDKQEDIVTDNQSNTIPETTANGHYWTSFEARYSNIMAGTNEVRMNFPERMVNAYGYAMILPPPGTSPFTVKAQAVAAIPYGGKNYQENEEIVIHSPVISPYTVYGEDTVQLTPEAKDGNVVQLLLDGTYTVKFDWGRYFTLKGYDWHEVGDNEPGFTTYVKEKLVRFPYDVKVNGKFYYVHEGTDGMQTVLLPDGSSFRSSRESGFTDWIQLGGDCREFKFYIPSWAKEGVYGDTGYTAYNSHPEKKIQVKVFANNYLDDAGQVMEEYLYNSNLNCYVADYDYASQVSGVLYDFMVTGVNDNRYFNPDPEMQDEHGVAQLFYNKWELRVGDHNRFGRNLQRHYLDGTLADWQYIDTLPFTNGKSHAYSDMGFLVPGNKIGYTMRTIANLNGQNDKITIRPVYRYIAPDGTVYEQNQLNLWYSKTRDGNLYKFGSENDTAQTDSLQSSYHELDLCDPLNSTNSAVKFRFQSTFNPVSLTAEKFGQTENYVLFHETPSNSAGAITLFSTQKLLYGTETELEANETKQGSGVYRYNDGNAVLGEITDDKLKEFQTSMQTWYGAYQIPNYLYVTVNLPDGRDPLIAKAEADGMVDLHDSDIFKKDGWLVLTFEIETWADGTHKHLTYYKQKDMWDIEKGNMARKITAKTLGGKETEINLRDGDIALIDVSTNYTDDHYGVGILYIN